MSELIGLHSVTRYPRTRAKGTAGGLNAGSDGAGKALACTVSPASTSTRIEKLQEGYVVNYELYFLEDPASNHDDVFVRPDGSRLYQQGATVHWDATLEMEQFWQVFANKDERRQDES